MDTINSLLLSLLPQRLKRLWLNWTHPPSVTGSLATRLPWPALRKRHLQREPVCAMCGGSRRLEVHHIVPRHVAPEKALDPANLITLCRKDHLVHGHDGDFQHRWVPSIAQMAKAARAYRHVAQSNDVDA